MAQVANYQGRSTGDFFPRALALEREASARYGELERHFADHGMTAVAGLCRALAMDHDQSLQELSEASRGREVSSAHASPFRWIDGDSPEGASRAFLYVAAVPRTLLEIASCAESEGLRLYERFAAPAHPGLAPRMAAKAREHVRRLASAIGAFCPAVDWEPLIAGGGGPGSALGAERRLHGSRSLQVR